MVRSSWLIFILILLGCVDAKLLSKDNVVIDDEVNPDPGIEEIIKPYKDSLKGYMDEVIGELTMDMKRVKTRPETILGNFVADLSLEYALNNHTIYKPQSPRPDMCILNFGGLRTSLSKGKITRGNVFELMPFENYLVVVTLEYEDVIQMFDYLAKEGGQPISGSSLKIIDYKPVDVQINGKPVEKRSYYIVTSDYLANGGDNMTFFKGKSRYSLIKLRDAIMLKFENSSQPLSSKIEGRINSGK